MSEKLFHEWYLLKQKIAKLSAQEVQIREKVQQLMEEKGVEQLTSENYSVFLMSVPRRNLSKKNCPPEIWERYATTSMSKYCRLKKENLSSLKRDVSSDED